MAKGGARSRSGPAPELDALRRGRTGDGEWTVIPATPRTGRTPPWPLPDQTDREDELWRVFWRKPQARLWERGQQHHQVALHVRCLAEAEEPGAKTALRTLVRQQAESLLLTLPAMRAARIRLEDPPPRTTGPATVVPIASGRPSARERLQQQGSDGGA